MQNSETTKYESLVSSLSRKLTSLSSTKDWFWQRNTVEKEKENNRDLSTHGAESEKDILFKEIKKMLNDF